MAAPSSFPAYFFGTTLIATGLMSLARPLAAYEVFGVPPPVPATTASTTSTTTTATSTSGSDEDALAAVSPFVYSKAARDLSLGVAFLALQRQGNHAGFLTLSGALVIGGLCDGWVVWTRGGEELKHKAWGHWIPSVGWAVYLAGRGRLW